MSAVDHMMKLAEEVFGQGGKVLVHASGTKFRFSSLKLSGDKTAVRGTMVGDAEVVIPVAAMVAIQELADSYP